MIIRISTISTRGIVENSPRSFNIVTHFQGKKNDNFFFNIFSRLFVNGIALRDSNVFLRDREQIFL